MCGCVCPKRKAYHKYNFFSKYALLLFPSGISEKRAFERNS